MRNREGRPIWYELLTNDSKAMAAFYESVIGWKVPPPAPGTPHGYQMIDTASAHVGGMMQLTDDMKKNGAKPTWLFYVGVDDVDATAKKVEPAGGKLLNRSTSPVRGVPRWSPTRRAFRSTSCAARSRP